MSKYTLKNIKLIFLIFATTFIVSCQKQSGGDTPPPPPPPKCDLQIDPPNATIAYNDKQKFTVVGNNADTAIWEVGDPSCVTIEPTSSAREVYVVRNQDMQLTCATTITARTNSPDCKTQSAGITVQAPPQVCDLDPQNSISPKGEKTIKNGDTIKYSAKNTDGKSAEKIKWFIEKITGDEKCTANIETPFDPNTNILGKNSGIQSCAFKIFIQKQGNSTCQGGGSTLNIEPQPASCRLKKILPEDPFFENNQSVTLSALDDTNQKISVLWSISKYTGESCKNVKPSPSKGSETTVSSATEITKECTVTVLAKEEGPQECSISKDVVARPKIPQEKCKSLDHMDPTSITIESGLDPMSDQKYWFWSKNDKNENTNAKWTLEPSNDCKSSKIIGGSTDTHAAIKGINANKTKSCTIDVIAHDTEDDSCTRKGILTVTPSTLPRCLSIVPQSPVSNALPSNATIKFIAIGNAPSTTKWSSSDPNCLGVNPASPTQIGDHMAFVAQNKTRIQCTATISAGTDSCEANPITLTVDPIPKTAQCTNTSMAKLPPKIQGYLAITLLNEADCHTYGGQQITDDKIYVNFAGLPAIDPQFKSDNAPFDFNKIVPKPPRYVLNKTSDNRDGYPVYKLITASDGVVLPYLSLADLKEGSFYLATPDPFTYHYEGKTTEYTSHGVEAGIFYISIGQPLASMKISDQNQFSQPTEKIPWDIFELGFDPEDNRMFGFDTSQVTAFSIPIWFDVFPKRNQEDNPLPLGIRVLDKNKLVNPTGISSQQDIIQYYSNQYNQLRDIDQTGIFSIERLGEKGDSSGYAHIYAPPGTQGLPANSDSYFNSNVDNFLTKYARKSDQQWPLFICSGDPGKDSTLIYPGCAASGSSCPITNKFPQCDATRETDEKNTCNGVSPKGSRITGRCFIGYVENNSLNFFKFVSDSIDDANGGKCTGTIAYNGSTDAIINAPKELCTISNFSTKINTKCAFNNDCIANDDPLFNVQFMAALMRGVVTNTDGTNIVATINGSTKTTIPFTRWSYPAHDAPFYKTAPYNIYSKIFHDINAWHHGYTMGFDDAANQSTTYTPDPDVSNVIIGIGW